MPILLLSLLIQVLLEIYILSKFLFKFIYFSFTLFNSILFDIILYNSKISSDESFEALDDLIKKKTGVTLSKIQKYNHYIWDNNLYDSKLDKGNKSGKNIAYNHFFPQKQ